MKAIDPAGFEAKFRSNIDPWNYRTSRFEAVKRRTLLHACGSGSFGRALELACATGETSRAMAPRCLRLLAIDSSETAVEHARQTYSRMPRLKFRQAQLPDEMPSGPFDLIVISELAYYLTELSLRRLMRRVAREAAPGGRVVILHHLTPFGDAAQLPMLAQRRAIAWLQPRFAVTFRLRTARYEVVTLRNGGKRRAEF